jgi:hypothetical protein
MSPRAAVLRGVAAAALVAIAAVLVLLARDSWHWSRAIREADLRAEVGPIGPGAWQIKPTLPSGAVTQVLGIDGDLALRRALMQAIQLAADGATAFDLEQRVLVETSLQRIAAGDTNHTRASIAADYLGVLFYQDRLAPKEAINPYNNPANPSHQSLEQRAIAEFETAVVLDPNDSDAKSNLEAMLEQARPPNQQGNARPGNGQRVNNKGSGRRPPGYGY